MVRAHMKQPSEEKKETPKKRTPPKKKTVVTGVWPCKINGCNKQFAREADLKRHQRTTKLHSVPSFACPQCDATFTRTDALRRHQKSRHNGVIIEPAEPQKAKDGEDDEARSSGSKSKSRSGTPSAKSKDKATAPPTALAQPGTAGPAGGPSSYYRQHTATSSTTYILPRAPPGVVIDPQYPPGIALPTSATRLHQANWPPPWGPDGQGSSIGPMPHIAYHQVTGPHPIYYQPSPYYRPNPGMLPLHSQPPHQAGLTQGMQNGINSNDHVPTTDHNGSHPGVAMHGNVADPRLSHLDPNSNQRTSHTPDSQRGLTQSFRSAPVIDPSLDVSGNAPTVGTAHGDNIGDDVSGAESEDITALSLKITQAAMEAVLESVRRETNLEAVSLGPAAPDGLDVKHTNSMQGSVFQSNEPVARCSLPLLETNGDADIDGDANGDAEDERLVTNELTSNHGFHTPLHLSRPAPMAHILTEDGEPMLNPAELLTQESLASPPPS